jgi:membrane-associated phospholipid phosphatase
MALGSLASIDRATLAYVAFALLMTALRWPARLPGAWLLPVGLLLVAVCALVLAPRARRGRTVGPFLAEFYPLIATVALYEQAGLVNGARGISHDALVQAWERALFGGQPSLEWIRSCPYPPLSAVMHFAYLSYYLILAGAPLGLWLSGRRDDARRTLLLLMGTFYVCYALFLLFPVAGPRYVFPPARNAATAIPIAAFTHRLLEGGSAWGTAFPSSHVAVALVAAICAWRGWRPLGTLLLPLAVLLAFATVYGQFHYAADALAGGALAAVVLALDLRPPVRP